MRILVHDYAGHAFPVQLSRALAERGHTVRHAFSWATQTPRGELEPRPTDPPNLQIAGIDLGRRISKQSFLQRFQLEFEYGHRLIEVCDSFRPDVILSGQNPSLPQRRLAGYCDRKRIRLVSWVQDMYGVAAQRLLRNRFLGLGWLVGVHFVRLDRQSARLSNQIVVISEDFVPRFQSYGIPEEKIHVVHNWAPIESLPEHGRQNGWSRNMNLSGDCRFLYAGTLAMKHNPGLLLALALQLEKQQHGELIVISEGSGIDWLKNQAVLAGLSRIRLLPFQPFEELSEVLASGDVLISILEPDAGDFCVPSKILAYMCAGRPILSAMPLSNLASRIILRENVGLACEANDERAFLAAASKLAREASLRKILGSNARHYAEHHFDIDHICRRFEAILGAAGVATRDKRECHENR